MLRPTRAPFAQLSEYLAAKSREGFIPGAVAAAGRGPRPAYLAAFGSRAIRPRRQPMRRDTIFDLASLTKVMATAPLVAERAAAGEFSLDDRLDVHLPATRGTAVGRIPLHRLLTHSAGFPDDNPLADYRNGKGALLRAIAHEPLAARPGARFLYSDVGYVLLQLILERRTGCRLDRLAERELFRPLGFRDTRYGVRRRDLARVAPTTHERGRWLRGVVHDPRARSRALAGVAGHAGIFGTAADVARFAAMILGKGSLEGRPILSPGAVRLMTRNQLPAGLGVRRGYGFDIRSPYSSPRGALFGPRSFGHTGYTGVSLWIDPDAGAYFVLLTNSVHPAGHKDLKAFRAEAATLAAHGLGLR